MHVGEDAFQSYTKEMVMIVKECVDTNSIQKLEDLGGGKLVVQMITLFCENADDKIHKALQAWDQMDLLTIERSAHSLVSSSGNLGAFQMQELAMNIEKQAANGNTHSFPDLLNELQSAYHQARELLEEIKKGYEE